MIKKIYFLIKCYFYDVFLTNFFMKLIKFFLKDILITFTAKALIFLLFTSEILIIINNCLFPNFYII